MPSATRIAFPSRVGVFWGPATWSTVESQRVAREIEALGFGSLFFTEGGGKESLVLAEAFLGATERLVVGTGIANIYLRHAVSAEGARRTLGALYPGRFVLGLGVSHAPVLAGLFGVSSGSPLASMREYLTYMDGVSPDVEPGGERPARVLAAMGPKMHELAAELTDGVFPYNVTPETTREGRRILGPEKWLITVQAVSVGDEEPDRLRRAEAHVRFYSALPNYRNSWLRQGFTEADLEGSRRLVEGLVGVGTAGAIERVRAQFDAGADHVVVQPLLDHPQDDPIPQLTELARVLQL